MSVSAPDQKRDANGAQLRVFKKQLMDALMIRGMPKVDYRLTLLEKFETRDVVKCSQGTAKKDNRFMLHFLTRVKIAKNETRSSNRALIVKSY
jgi:hypothetical protein